MSFHRQNPLTWLKHLGRGVNGEYLAGHLRKVYPNESESLDCFASVRWYVDKKVSLDSVEEAQCLVGCYCKVILMGLQREIFLKINALNRERDQERISLKKGSSFQPLRQGSSSTEYIQQF